MKKILKYLIIFLIVGTICLSFLVATAKIPKELIAENVKKPKNIQKQRIG